MFENIENMIYNNVDFDDKFNNGDDDYFIINDVKGRGEYSENLSTIRVTGLDGVIIGGQQASEQYIEIHFTIKSPSYDSLHKKLESLLDTLYSEEDVPITFSDENGRTYFGRFREIVRSYEGSKIFKGIIYILRADPYKYGEEKQVNFSSDTVVVENQGTAPADPIFELEVNEPTTFAMVSNGEDYMMIGRPVDVDDIAVNRLQTVLNDNCSSLVGWTHLPAGTQLDTGIVGGQMEVQGGYAFSAASYGTNPNGWVGPAIRKSLSETVQDFRCEIRIGAFNTYGDVGSLELHLLDENDNVVAIMAMRDSIARYAENRAVIQLGQEGNRHSFLNFNGGYRATWNDFSGIIRLEREGTEFRGYVAMLDDGRHIRRYTVRPTFYDRLGEYQAPIAQVLVYDAKAKEYTSYDKLMNNIYIGKINQEVGIPYIADEGDTIQFDHQTGDCYINGEPVPFDFGADFFRLKKGFNTLAVMPENTFNTSVKYRERYR